MEIQQPKISVIVAVYNAEKYLRRCIDSLLAQTFTDFEVLLIDDGSTDSSGEICDEYAAKDSRFLVFHNENQGIGSTRHFGINHAKGEYTIHVDSDDWVEQNFLEELYLCASDSLADMIICDYVAERKTLSERIGQHPMNNNSSNVFLEVLKGNLSGVCWNKLIKVDCNKRYNVNFIEGLNCGEDLVYVCSLLQNDISIAYCPSTCYHYDQYTSDNSYTRHVKKESLQQQERALLIIENMVMPKEYRVYILNKLHKIAYLSIRFGSFSAKSYKERFEKLKELSFSETISHPLQERIFVWLSLHFSYRFSLSLMKLKLGYRKLFHKDKKML